MKLLPLLLLKKITKAIIISLSNMKKKKTIYDKKNLKPTHKVLLSTNFKLEKNNISDFKFEKVS